MGRLGVDHLEDSDGEGGGLSGSGLSLSNGISSADNGEDSLLLNDRWLFKTERIDPPQEFGV